MIILFFIFLALAYVIGSLNSAIIVCKLMGLLDPRGEGSGNPGATNVLRVAGRNPAILVLVIDVLKGYIPVTLAYWFGLDYMALGLVAVAAVIGHIFPIFFNFKGGRGVATSLGALLGLSLLLGIIALIIWIAVAALTRYSSLASLSAAVGAAILSPWLAGNISYIIPIVIIALLIFWRHMDNIQRLRAGAETRINLGKFNKKQ